MGHEYEQDPLRYVVWKPEMSVHSKAIDIQHRQVVSLLNELHMALRTPGLSIDMAGLLLRLRIFTETHFAYEEAVLRMLNYPTLDPHKAMHDAMIARTREVVAGFSSGSGDYTALLHFLRDWWLGHIQGVDRLYSPYLENLGL
jgi:hemerythrin